MGAGSHLGRALGAAVAGAALLGAIAAPLPLVAQDLGMQAGDSFVILPPEVEPRAICPVGEDPRAGEDWLPHWVNGAFEPARMAGVRGDFKRLQATDAVQWEGEIERAIAWLEANDPDYTARHAAHDRISLVLKLERPEDVLARGLFEALTGGEDGMTAAHLVTAAELLLEGRVVPLDRVRGLGFLARAAMSGQAEAIFQLLALEAGGEDIPGWQVEREMALEIARTAVAGTLDPWVCARATRIARMYEYGTTVPRNVAVAEAWLRFAADLGDLDAAWRVVRFHLDAMEIERDVDVMVRYLELSAEAGLPEARLLLARILEDGALVERDLDRAFAIHSALVEEEVDEGRVRLIALLDRHGAHFEDGARLRIDQLEQLSQIEEARGWVFTHLARDVLERKGRWDGAEEARTLLETAIARGDDDALRLMARLLLDDPSPAAFNRVIELLRAALTREGDPAIAGDLAAAFMCHAPGAPMREMGAHWDAMAEDLGVRTRPLEPREIDARIWIGEPDILARLQTRALNRVPRALANYAAAIVQTGAAVPGDEAAFRALIAASPGAMRFWGRQMADPEGDASRRAEALAAYREALAGGDLLAAADLAALLLEDGAGPEARAEAMAALERAADTGHGKAMAMIGALHERIGTGTMEGVYLRFEPVIASRGDFDAMLLEMRHGRPWAFEDAYRRAVASMSCLFDEAAALARVFDDRGDAAQAERWNAVAALLVRDDPARMVRMGDLAAAIGGPAAEGEAVAHYERAHRMGSPAAEQRLARVLGDPGSVAFDPDRSAALLVGMLGSDDPERVSLALGRMTSADAAVRARVSAQVNLGMLYALAAGRGDRMAMREFADTLRGRARTDMDLAEAAGWYRKAAEAGDAQAMYEYAQMLSFGLGMDADAEAGRAWLERAAMADNAGARRLLPAGALTGR